MCRWGSVLALLGLSAAANLGTAGALTWLGPPSTPPARPPPDDDDDGASDDDGVDDRRNKDAAADAVHSAEARRASGSGESGSASHSTHAKAAENVACGAVALHSGGGADGGGDGSKVGHDGDEPVRVSGLQVRPSCSSSSVRMICFGCRCQGVARICNVATVHLWLVVTIDVQLCLFKIATSCSWRSACRAYALSAMAQACLICLQVVDSAGSQQNGTTGALLHFTPVTLALHDLHSYTQKKQSGDGEESKESAVLEGVSCAFLPGTVTALLCASSSGASQRSQSTAHDMLAAHSQAHKRLKVTISAQVCQRARARYHCCPVCAHHHCRPCSSTSHSVVTGSARKNRCARAGKACLTDVIAGRAPGGRQTGSVTVNGSDRDADAYARAVGCCSPQDTHMCSARVGESLHAIGRLRHGSTYSADAVRFAFLLIVHLCSNVTCLQHVRLLLHKQPCLLGAMQVL